MHSTAKTRAGFFISLLVTGILNSAFAADPVAQMNNPIGTSSAGSANVKSLTHLTKRADFAREKASEDARHIADWVVDSADNQNLPFVIIDKKNARAFVFDADGQIKGAASVLLGLALGDDSIPGIGERKLSTIRQHERTTPAGRFVATLDRNLHGAEILWVDYDAAISLHRVITSNPKERRAERLASSTLTDKRISYGCINVPAKFFDEVVLPAFRKANGIVYILPETRPSHQTFGNYNVDEQAVQALTPISIQALPTTQTIKLR